MKCRLAGLPTCRPADLPTRCRRRLADEKRSANLPTCLRDVEEGGQKRSAGLPTCLPDLKMKWNESGFRPPLCTYRLNWARITSWGWWDEWHDAVLQTQDLKFEPWQSEAEHATSRSRRLPTILSFTRGWGRNIFVSFKPPRLGTEPRTLAWKAPVLTTILGPPPLQDLKECNQLRS